MLSTQNSPEPKKEGEETKERRLFTPFDCLIIGSGWNRIKGNKPPMSWDGQTINKLLGTVDPDKDLVFSYLPALRELTEIYSSDVDALKGGFNLVTQRAYLLCQQVLQLGSVVEALDPRTDYAKERGYTINPQEAKRIVKSEIRGLKNLLDRLDRVLDSGGVLDVTELDMIQSGLDSIIEGVKCCEWATVINSAQMVADYVRAKRQPKRGE